MVRKPFETGLEQFSVECNALKQDGREIAKFTTPICELARLDDKLFVALHPYCLPLDREYAGTNLLAIDLKANILWHARNLNPKPIVWPGRPGSTPIESLPHSYTDITLFEHNKEVLILAATTNDRVHPIIKVETGEEIGGLGNVWKDADIKKLVVSHSTRYMLIVPGAPPEIKKGDHLHL